MSPRLIPLALTTAMLGLLLASGRSSPSVAFEPVSAAAPQTASVGWVERFPESPAALIYDVKILRIKAESWEAEIAIENLTDRTYSIPAVTSAASRVFGVMMFASGDLADLKRRSETADYPAVRGAQTVVPELPPVLEPGESWAGTIAAAGSLPAEKWLRVVFGPLTVKGDVPKGVPAEVIWITDHAYQLRGAPSGEAASIATLANLKPGVYALG